MNQIAIGQFIARKRKEKNFTQEQLAEKLGVSNKTISKWETGKCMPDYSIVKSLCDELEFTVAELIDGESAEKSVRSYDEDQILDLLRRTQEVEQQKKVQYGVLLIVMGIALLAFSYNYKGSVLQDLLSGLMWGISIAASLIGVYITIRNLSDR